MCGTVFKSYLLNAFLTETRTSFLTHANLIHFDKDEPADTSMTLFFPEVGEASQTSFVAKNNAFEIISIGNEGLVGIDQIFTPIAKKTYHWVGEGSAWAVPLGEFRNFLKTHSDAQKIIATSMGLYIDQLQRQVVCCREHMAESRFVTALLMAHHRNGNNFQMTQNSISQRLDVSRTGINAIAGRLAAEKVIVYARGKMQILDVTALKAFACTCYQHFVDDRKVLTGLNDHKVLDFEKLEIGAFRA